MQPSGCCLLCRHWLEMADWSNFMRPCFTKKWVRDDGSLVSEWQTWGPRQWTLLFSLWINCPPFKTLFLNRLVEEQLTLEHATQSAVGSGTDMPALSEAASLGLQAIAPRSPFPSTPSSSGRDSGGSIGAQTSGGQAQPVHKPCTQRSPEAPNPSSVDLTDLPEAELALALLRMGLPGNMFERGAPLHPDLQHCLVHWGRREWYTNILRSARQGMGSREPLPGAGAPQSQVSVPGFGQQSQQQQQLQHNPTLGQGTSDSAGRAGPSKAPDDVTALLLSVKFVVQREEACLKALHLAGCPQDLHTQLRLPKSWPVNNDSSSTGQLQQLLMGTIDGLMQLPDSAVLGPGIMTAMAGIVSHRRKLFEMYAAPHNGSSSSSISESSSDHGPLWPGQTPRRPSSAM
ncbi:hypothetical protein V8C86DRAFT_1468203 [Haematococcus lacustris]